MASARKRPVVDEADPALELLLEDMADWPDHSLWVAGEEAHQARLPRPLSVLTCRADVANHLAEQGASCTLNPLDFSPWPLASLAVAGYRIGKEKAAVHHVVNALLQRLQPEGRLVLTGHRQEGMKSLVDRLAAAEGLDLGLSRHGKGLLRAEVRRRSEMVAPVLADRGHGVLRELELEPGLTLFTAPGIFGWDKVDAGSRLLVETLEQQGEELWPRPPQRVLDLGCGYGYLTVRAGRHWPGVELVATDSHAGAVQACAANLARQGLNGQALLADCAAGVAGRFDAVLCNPPFHRGFDMVGHLGQRFLQRSRELLTEEGRALFVVNQFLPLERLARPLFGQCRELARNRGFKVLALQP